jgi:hypothetical protein
MAYTQSPGRGNNSKTGHGIPTPFKQEIELTSEYDKGKKTMADARKKGGKNYSNAIASIEGINVDVASGAATAKPYEKTFRPGEGQKGGGSRSRASIISGGKTVKESGAGLFKESNEKLYKEYKADSTSTMNSRNKNAAQYNITGGAKSPENADARDKDTLIKLRKAIAVKK